MTKSWTQAAADEINDGCGRDCGNDADDTRKIIERHCPVKPGTAYMPVPRCDRCKHWRKSDDVPFGDCRLLVHGNYARELAVPRLAVADSDEENASLRTQGSFGCVQWEAKP